MADESTIRDTAETIKGIVQAVPIYQDVVQPAAKEVGTALQTVAKTLHILLAPVSGLVWGYEKIKDFVSETVAAKLQGVPEDELRQPEPHVAGPVLEALRYTGYQEDLRAMYANLLATSIDSATSVNAHPAFVEIIKQMSPDEALIVKSLSRLYSSPKIDIRSEDIGTSTGRWLIRNFSLLPLEAGCKSLGLGSTYMVNLERLGIVELRETYTLRGENGTDLYLPLISSPQLEAINKHIEADSTQMMKIDKGMVALTELGRKFCLACVNEGTHVRS